MSIRVGYQWHLRQVMASRGLRSTASLLIPLLSERGVTLSTAQVHRLVTQPPDRLNLRALAALCDGLSCTASDLVEVYALHNDEDAPA